MPQFGTGPQLAAQCPRVQPPDGWRPWTDADGPIPDALAQRALQIASDQAIPLGITESYPIPGVTTLIRVEPHTWNRNADGALVEGCFRASAVYLPVGTPAANTIAAPSESSGLSKAIAILTAVSLAVGTVATIATWKNRRR